MLWISWIWNLLETHTYFLLNLSSIMRIIYFIYNVFSLSGVKNISMYYQPRQIQNGKSVYNVDSIPTLKLFFCIINISSLTFFLHSVSVSILFLVFSSSAILVAAHTKQDTRWLISSWRNNVHMWKKLKERGCPVTDYINPLNIKKRNYPIC